METLKHRAIEILRVQQLPNMHEAPGTITVREEERENTLKPKNNFKTNKACCVLYIQGPKYNF